MTARAASMAIVAALIPSFYGTDVLLHRVETRELDAEAAGFYTRGQSMLQMGDAADAVEPLHRAFTLERANREYELTYAEAIIGAGQTDRAAELLDELARRAPNDGRTNLLMARVAKAHGDFTNEAAYYHRAIYGVWTAEASQRRSAARLEWIRELNARGEKRLMLGELLPLEVETRDFGVLKQTADLLREAGSPGRAADLYGTLLADHRDDADLNEGLGRAEAQAGNYAAAHASYLRASQLRPGDQTIARDMALAAELSQLDPTSRHLPSRTKYERSIRILQLTRDAVSGCGAKPESIAEADRALKNRHPDYSNEEAESVLQTALNLWKQRTSNCPAPDVLPLMMAKIEQ